MDIDQKIKKAAKDKELKIREIASIILNSLDNVDDWTTNQTNNMLGVCHRRFNLEIRKISWAKVKLLRPDNILFSRSESSQMIKKIKAIYSYNEYQSLSFVYDVASGKFPLYIHNYTISQEWLQENDPDGNGYIKRNNVVYFTDEALAMAYKLTNE